MSEEKKEKTERARHGNIHEALSAFQGELKPMAKSGEVEFDTTKGKVKFSYTPLGEIMATIYPLLAKHGLAVRHEITEKGVEAILTHETYREGKSIFVTTRDTKIASDDGNITGIEMDGTNLQKFETAIQNEIRSGIVKMTQGGGQMKDTGAAITYARRYTLTMVLGIASEEDKDATLLEQSGKNAIQYAFGRAKKGLEDAKTVKDVDKAEKVLKSDLEALQKGKAPALGLSKEQYEELIKFAEGRKTALTNTDEQGTLIQE